MLTSPSTLTVRSSPFRKIDNCSIESIPHLFVAENRRYHRYTASSWQSSPLEAHTLVRLKDLCGLRRRCHWSLGYWKEIAVVYSWTAHIDCFLASLERRLNTVGIRRLRRPHHSMGFAVRRKYYNVRIAGFRKSAHNNAITQVELASIIYQGKPTTVILSTGKDGFFKLWHAETRLCLGVISTAAT